MEIARERFLDDTRQYHVTLMLRSRTSPDTSSRRMPFSPLFR